ncbi:hypothetical protein M9Y10_018130 [Tritrichomonas musculus]|uniref:Uncharacterized protein n=1 Tax=Tritrichomonas musculus TaxID=1915356 RepID=A0ABR2GLL8_9EUKA
MLKDITSINELFFYFLPHDKKFDKKKIKLGKEHRSPFDNIKENTINIGIFGRENVNITKLWFRFVYEEFYQHFSQDFETNLSEIELTKIVEISNEIVSISVIDTTFAGKNEYKKHYFELQGFIFGFNIDAIFKPTYKEEIFKVYNEMKDIVGEDLIFAIALVIQNLENIQNKLEDQITDERIEELCKYMKSEIFIISSESGENINNIFHFLSKQILNNRKMSKSTKKKKKRTKHKNKYHT